MATRDQKIRDLGLLIEVNTDNDVYIPPNEPKGMNYAYLHELAWQLVNLTREDYEQCQRHND